MEIAEQQLIKLFAKLGAANQASLLAFAEFLATRGGVPATVTATPVVVPEPETIERPAKESIVAGLKRLAKTYPMLDKSKMLSATSDLVATNIMQGTDPGQVIDELEAIFAKHYQQLKSGANS
jgi:hypothetical protein